MIFCTLFNRRYLAQGIALYFSLERTLRDDFKLYVLCMDEFSAQALERLELKHVHIIRLDDFEDDALRAVKLSRSVGEYCWTCTAPLLQFVLATQPAGAVVSYVDADILFFSSPRALLAELGGNNILIHEHDFAAEYAHFRNIAGRFNVGIVAVRNSEEGRACLGRWGAQCLVECTVDVAAGKCGDQNYLDEWPDRYRSLIISANPGIGLGPWNISKRQLQRKDGVTLVDDRPVVFYHYHALQLCKPRFGLRPLMMARSTYSFTDDVARLIYRPYAKELWAAVSRLKAIGMPITGDLEPITLKDIVKNILHHIPMTLSIGGFAIQTT